MQINIPSRTAVGIASARARESARPEGERLFYDPFASHFLSKNIRIIAKIAPLRALFRWYNRFMLPGMFGGLVIRTCYIDDYMSVSLKKGVEQLVILGAGYDARAYRFKKICRRIRVFEVDHPATQKNKIDKLEQILGCLPEYVTFVPIRFNSENLKEKMVQKGYSQDLKSLFIWEGVTMYLTADSVNATLDFIAGQSAPGSFIIFDYFPPSVADGTCLIKEARTLRKMLRRYGEELRFGVEPKFIFDFLGNRGFHRIHSVSAEQCRSYYFKGVYTDLPVSRLFHFAYAEVQG